MFLDNNSYNLLLKDYEIDVINFKYILDSLRNYLNNQITKSQLIDIHSERNKLFGEWCYLYEIYINK